MTTKNKFVGRNFFGKEQDQVHKQFITLRIVCVPGIYDICSKYCLNSFKANN